MFREEINKRSFITGLLTGSVIGGFAALLFAPKSGREFRKDISDKSNELLEEANHHIDNANKKASSILTDAAEKAEKMIGEGKKKVESFTKSAGDYISHGKDIAGNEMSNVKEAVNTGVGSYNEEKHTHKDKSKTQSSDFNKNKNKH